MTSSFDAGFLHQNEQYIPETVTVSWLCKWCGSSVLLGHSINKGGKYPILNRNGTDHSCAGTAIHDAASVILDGIPSISADVDRINRESSLTDFAADIIRYVNGKLKSFQLELSIAKNGERID
jgi:hypothetical protein